MGKITLGEAVQTLEVISERHERVLPETSFGALRGFLDIRNRYVHARDTDDETRPLWPELDAPEELEDSLCAILCSLFPVIQMLATRVSSARASQSKRGSKSEEDGS